MKKQIPFLKVMIGVVVLMTAELAPAAPYEVAGPEAPKPHECTATNELAAYLAKRVAGTLRVGGKDNVVFRVGDTELARKEGLLSTQLPSEKWVVRSFGNEVLLNGGGPRGALFAVYHFLEDCCGVRWWSEFEEDVPPAGPLDLPALDMQGQPAFAYRDIYRAESGKNPPRFERRVRMNAHGGAELGGAYCFGPPNFCHTFDWYLSADKYMKDHPEWFSLRKGRRVGGQRSGQLCLTNPEVKDEVLKRLLENIEKGTERAKKKGVEPPRIYDMSHNDNQSYCQCDRCNAAAEKYGLSGVNLNFVNALAAEVAKKYPDVLLCTWAYQYTQPVPKGGVRAADNVIVRLCDTGSNQASSIAEPDNRAYYDCVIAWSKVTKHLFVWDYAITFSKGLTDMPFPSEFHYGDLFRHYRAYNVSGIFWEHEHPSRADMWELKFFLETKLMENPDLDCNALIERFMREYYGPAGEHILAYRRYLDKIRREKNAFVSWFPQLSAFKYISDEDVVACNRMLDAAEASVAGDAKLLARARHARLGLDRLICLRSRAVLFYVPGQGIAAERKIPGLDDAKKRLREDWPKWLAPYPRGKELIKKEHDFLAGVLAPPDSFPVPEQFRDRSFYDFPAQFLTGHGKNEALVDDPESPIGRAMRTAADKSHYFQLPFSGGVYDQQTKKSCGSGSFKKVAGDGYHWYRLCKAKFNDHAYLWLTRAWTTQLRSGNFPDLNGKELELWVSVKFTGPMFRPGTKGDSYIWIDRVILAVPEKTVEAPKINGPTIYGVRPGSPIIYRLPVTGTRPFALSAKGLPPGVTFDAAKGLLGGAATARGTNVIEFTARNAAGVATKRLRLVVGDLIALTPPMGFNTFGGLGGGPMMNEANVRKSFRALVDKGLVDHGYAYCNLDDGWQGLRGGPYNAIQPNEKFGDMKRLFDDMHAEGLKAGIYSTPWGTSYQYLAGGSSDDPNGRWDGDRSRTTGWRVKRYMFDVQDIRQFVAWGCDYFKYDWGMGEKPHQPGLPHIYYAGRIGATLGAHRRDVVLELSNAAPFGEAANFTEIGNMTRTGSDLIDIWSHASAARKMKVADWAMGILDTMDKVRRWQPYNRPGHWNMPCPTRVGMLGGWDEKPLAPSRLTKDEQVTHISLWCLWSSPIIIGCPIDLLDDWTLALLTNDEMLDLDQDALGVQAIDKEVAGGRVLVKPLENGDVAVGFVNVGDEGPKDITVTWPGAGLKGPCAARDLWAHRDLGVVDGSFTARAVPQHGCRVIRFALKK